MIIFISSLRFVEAAKKKEKQRLDAPRGHWLPREARGVVVVAVVAGREEMEPWIAAEKGI
jgi:hypothetical protein